MSEWRAVVGYEGTYEASDAGQVRRTNGAVLSPWVVMGTGYQAVSLSSLGRVRKHNVHALIAAAFIGPRPTGHEVNHLDSVRTNNRVENLEYVTHGNNIRHAYRNNPAMRVPRTQGERVNTAKLTPDAVREIRQSIESSKSLAVRYKVSPESINNIRRRATWKHIE